MAALSERSLSYFASLELVSSSSMILVVHTWILVGAVVHEYSRTFVLTSCPLSEQLSFVKFPLFYLLIVDERCGASQPLWESRTHGRVVPCATVVDRREQRYSSASA